MTLTENILAQSPPTCKAPSPLDPIARNRALLIKALRGGLEVRYQTGSHSYLTNSRSSTVPHLVSGYHDSLHNLHEACECDWARREQARTREGACCVHYNAGTRQAHVVGQPCGHILIVRFDRLYDATGAPSPELAALLAQDTELAAAVAASRYAHGRPWGQEEAA